MIYDERAKMVLWDYVPNKSSRQDIINAMKQNLEKANHTDITEFSFSINKPYTKRIIGEGPYNTGFRYTLLPDFTGDTEAQARATASKIGITVTFDGAGGTVVEQSYPANKRVDLIKGSVTLKLSRSKSDIEKEEKEKKEKEEKEKEKEKEDKTEDDTTADQSSSTDSSSTQPRIDNDEKDD